MAKRRKISEEEETGEVFKEPEFDEQGFLRNEIKKAKGIIILFLIAIGVGLLSAYIQIGIGSFVAYALGILVIFSLKPILKALKAEFSDRNTWIFAILAFLILWISFWSVGLNPPFNDVSPPQVRVIEVQNTTTWVKVYDYEAQYDQGLKKDIDKNIKNLNLENVTAIRVLVTDNVEVGAVYINGELATVSNGYYEIQIQNFDGKITISAQDISGHRTVNEFNISTGK